MTDGVRRTELFDASWFDADWFQISRSHRTVARLHPSRPALSFSAHRSEMTWSTGRKPSVSGSTWFGGAAGEERSGSTGRIDWLDIVLPAGDPLGEPDVQKAFYWLGDLFVEVLRQCDRPDRGLRSASGCARSRPTEQTDLFCRPRPGRSDLATAARSWESRSDVPSGTRCFSAASFARGTRHRSCRLLRTRGCALGRWPKVVSSQAGRLKVELLPTGVSASVRLSNRSVIRFVHEITNY